MNRFSGLRFLGPYLRPYRGRTILAAFSLLIAAGTVLAFGAWRAGVLPWWRALALAGMLALMLGVLKGSSWVSVACLVGLAVAFVPLGVDVLADGPRPRPLVAAAWVISVPVLTVLAYFFGRLG